MSTASAYHGAATDSSDNPAVGLPAWITLYSITASVWLQPGGCALPCVWAQRILLL